MRVPPGPRGRSVLGFFGGGSLGGTLEFLRDTAQRYGPICSFRILHKRIYLIDDAELIKDILVTRQHSFERDSGAQLLKELVGDALITREEPLHRERRRVLQPAFHKEQIARYAEIMARETRRLASEWREGATVDVRAEMRRLTLAIVGSSLFGADFSDSAQQVAAVLEGVTKRSRWLAPAMTFLEPLVVRYRRLLPRGPSLFFASERKELDRIIAPILKLRKGSAGKAMLSVMLNSSGETESLREEDVRNEIVTFVLAGHETTATALTWTWYLLSRNPAVAHKLRDELDSVLGDREPTLDDVARLTYTNAVFQEAMRLYPPALAFARRTKERLELAGYTVPKGASIFLSPYITQRNSAYFAEPDQFRPERWERHSAPKFAYFPFGGGAKICIGEPFAKLEGLLVLATLARQWRLEMVDAGIRNLAPGFLLNSAAPMLAKTVTRVTANLQST